MLATFVIVALWGAAFVMLIVGRVDSAGTEISLRLWSIIPGVLGWVVLAFATITVVAPGEVGLPVTFGTVGTPLSPGIHLVAPWTSITTLSTKTQAYTMSHVTTEGAKAGDDSVTVQTKDNASVTIDSTVLYHVATASARDIIRRYGTDYVDKIVRPTIRTDIRDAATAFDAVDLGVAGRRQFEASTSVSIEAGLARYGLVLESVKIRDIGLPSTVTDAINAKLQAAQEVQRQQFRLQTAQLSADIKRTDAKATADSQQIIACGSHYETIDGKRTVIPNGIAQCQQQQLTPQYLQYIYIQALAAMANSPNHSTIILPFDQRLTPLIQVK